MNPTKIIFAKEKDPQNETTIWKLRLLAPREHRQILEAFASASFDGLKLVFQDEANQKNDHWLVPVPGGMRVHAQLLAEEIEKHLRKGIDPDLDLESAWI